MRVRVLYLAQLRHAAGRPADEVPAAAPLTAAQFLAELAALRPPLRAALLTPDGRPQPTLLIFLGDVQVTPDHLLRPGDEVTLLTPVAGGGPDAHRPHPE